MKVHQKLCGHNPQSGKNLHCEDEEQVTGSILMAFTTVQQMLLLCSNISQWIPLRPPGKVRSASQLEHNYLKCGT